MADGHKVISVNSALAAFDFAPEANFNCGKFDAVLRHLSPTSQSIKAEITKRSQRAKRMAVTLDASTMTGSVEEDVDLFCKVCLVSWTMTDDEGEEVPIELARQIFLETGTRGLSLYYKLVTLATDDTQFQITPEDREADLKNS